MTNVYNETKTAQLLVQTIIYGVYAAFTESVINYYVPPAFYQRLWRFIQSGQISEKALVRAHCYEAPIPFYMS